MYGGVGYDFRFKRLFLPLWYFVRLSLLNALSVAEMGLICTYMFVCGYTGAYMCCFFPVLDASCGACFGVLQVYGLVLSSSLELCGAFVICDFF